MCVFGLEDTGRMMPDSVVFAHAAAQLVLAAAVIGARPAPFKRDAIA
jgi:hypothetical protein